MAQRNWFIRELDGGDVELVLEAADLFDAAPTRTWTQAFLDDTGHHLLMALDETGRALGFVTGVELIHPDKGREIFVYELSVAPAERRRGGGAALVTALRDLARNRGCHSVWVVTEPGNTAARATYAAVGLDVEPTVTYVAELDG